MTATSLKEHVRSRVPPQLWSRMRRLSRNLRGIPIGESAKARPRRTREGFFDAYCRGRGLDIGFGDDLLAGNCDGWDKPQAQYLHGLADGVYDFVYSSHTLEHMVDPAMALRNWWRILKPRAS